MNAVAPVGDEDQFIGNLHFCARRKLPLRCLSTPAARAPTKPSDVTVRGTDDGRPLNFTFSDVGAKLELCVQWPKDGAAQVSERASYGRRFTEQFERNRAALAWASFAIAT